MVAPGQNLPPRGFSTCRICRNSRAWHFRSVLFFLKWTTYPITSSPHAPPASYSYRRLRRSNQQPTLVHLGTCLASNQTYSARTAFSKPGERSHEIPQSGLMAETGWSHSGKIIFPKYSKVKPPFADPHDDVGGDSPPFAEEIRTQVSCSWMTLVRSTMVKKTAFRVKLMTTNIPIGHHCTSLEAPLSSQ